jgi:DNA-binding CsgD family transcriptional regulator
LSQPADHTAYPGEKPHMMRVREAQHRGRRPRGRDSVNSVSRTARGVIQSSTHLDLLAGVVECIGDAGLWEAIARWVQGVINCGPPIIYLFEGKLTPEILFQPFAGPDIEIQVGRYLAGPYLLDPFHNACVERVPSGLYCLNDLAPDQFQQSQYFRDFYRYADLLDEVCFLSQMPRRNAYVVISLARFQYERSFSKADLVSLRGADGFIQAVLRKHWARFTVEEPELTHAHRAMEDFGYPLLTHREREVATLILRGHSSKSASALLKISAETVRNHRKKLYSKLGVRSQSQLFSLFINQALSKETSDRGAPQSQANIGAQK